KIWVDKGNSPLFVNRWRALDGCLVSIRGGGTGDDVRTGKARGKLIFRLAGDDIHPLAKLSIERWKATRGVEVFYGKGLPSILGKHPSGDTYRLDGILGDAPDWLVEGLTPSKNLTAGVDGRSSFSSNVDGHHQAEPVEVDAAKL